MSRIVFQSAQLSVRGTEIALFDYARYNQEILGNESIIAFSESSPLNNSDVIRKFENSFPVCAYTELSALDRVISRANADLLYSIKISPKQTIESAAVPTMIHEVFPAKPAMFHGSAYAFVSEWLSQTYSNGKIPAVPHIVSLPPVNEDFRSALRIPEGATVFGCHGGRDSFDIEFAKQTVAAVLAKNKGIYFVFLNIAKFVSHERALFLPGTADLDDKIRFINTCDAMLHARKRGETFGLACAEFSVRNKPVLTYSRSGERNHIDVLGAKAQLYHGPKSLESLLLGFDRESARALQWDCYSERFSPAAVMAAFDQHFIKRALANGVGDSPDLALSLSDRATVLAHRTKIRGIKLSRSWAKHFS